MKKNVTTNKRRTKIVSRCKSMLYLWKNVTKKFANYKNYQKIRDHCHFAGKYRGAAHSICNLKFNVPNETPVVFHNSSNYEYHFIVKELTNKFEKQFECLGQNTEKYKTVSVPTGKEVINTDKDNNEGVVTISSKIKFIGSAIYMATSLSNLVDNLKESKLNVKILIVSLNMRV